MTLGKKTLLGGVECWYELNLLHHVGVVAKRLCAAAERVAAHEGLRQYPFGPNGPRGKHQPLEVLSRYRDPQLKAIHLLFIQIVYITGDERVFI